MLYSCNHMAPVGVKGLKTTDNILRASMTASKGLI